MEAPEKIYLSDFTDTTESVFYVKQDNTKNTDIEYIRKDAFIEKICNLLDRMIWEVTYEDLEGDSTQHYDKMEFIEDIKNYIKENKLWNI